LKTGICDLTKPLTLAAGELAVLGEGYLPTNELVDTVPNADRASLMSLIVIVAAVVVGGITVIMMIRRRTR